MCTYWNKVSLKKSSTKNNKRIDSIGIGLASPEEIRHWGERQLPNGTLVGKVDRDHTVDYESLKPIEGGLFCERIFGPVEDFYCSCERRGEKNEKFCPDCEVEFTKSRVRRTRMGHIPLAVPVAHVWYLRGRPSYIANLIGKSRNTVDKLAYGETLCESFVGNTSINYFKHGLEHLVESEKCRMLNFDFSKSRKVKKVNEFMLEVAPRELEKRRPGKSKTVSEKFKAPMVKDETFPGGSLTKQFRKTLRPELYKPLAERSTLRKVAERRGFAHFLQQQGSRNNFALRQWNSGNQYPYEMATHSTSPRSAMMLSPGKLLLSRKISFSNPYKSNTHCVTSTTHINYVDVTMSSRLHRALTSPGYTMLEAAHGIKAKSNVFALTPGRKVLDPYGAAYNMEDVKANVKKRFHKLVKVQKNLEFINLEKENVNVNFPSPYLSGAGNEVSEISGDSLRSNTFAVKSKVSENTVQEKYHKFHTLPIFSTFIYKEWSHRFSFLEYFIWSAREDDLALPFYTPKNTCHRARVSSMKLIKNQIGLEKTPKQFLFGFNGYIKNFHSPKNTFNFVLGEITEPLNKLASKKMTHWNLRLHRVLTSPGYTMLEAAPGEISPPVSLPFEYGKAMSKSNVLKMLQRLPYASSSARQARPRIASYASFQGVRTQTQPSVRYFKNESLDFLELRYKIAFSKSSLAQTKPSFPFTNYFSQSPYVEGARRSVKTWSTLLASDKTGKPSQIPKGFQRFFEISEFIKSGKFVRRSGLSQPLEGSYDKVATKELASSLQSWNPPEGLDMAQGSKKQHRNQCEKAVKIVQPGDFQRKAPRENSSSVFRQIEKLFGWEFCNDKETLFCEKIARKNLLCSAPNSESVSLLSDIPPASQALPPNFISSFSYFETPQRHLLTPNTLTPSQLLAKLPLGGLKNIANSESVKVFPVALTSSMLSAAPRGFKDGVKDKVKSPRDLEFKEHCNGVMVSKQSPRTVNGSSHNSCYSLGNVENLEEQVKAQRNVEEDTPNSYGEIVQRGDLVQPREVVSPSENRRGKKSESEMKTSLQSMIAQRSLNPPEKLEISFKAAGDKRQNSKWQESSLIWGKVDDTQQFPRLAELLHFTGGTALRHLLGRFHLVRLGKFLRHELKNLELKVNFLLALKMLSYSQGLLLGKLAKRRSKQIRRLKLLELFQSKKSSPEWMILSVLPVLPPDLRPILRVNDDFVVASDLNRLYQTVLRRNNTIQERLDDPLPCPESGLFRQRSLQKAVDGLLENGKGGATPLCASKRRPLVSLSHVLKGKKGLFRQHLLGKRVDYSGRSVIVVGPKLNLHECGLPKEMALELFQPFLIHRLKVKGLATSNTAARRMIQQEDPIIWHTIKQLVYEHPVLLNRAPTLHRLGIQAFQPRLVSGRAILLHPLVCNGFNADFDGDQMAVHVPLSFQARAEAWKIMWSKNNLLSPATGQPILVPSQDMVLGCYYLSVFVPSFSNPLGAASDHMGTSTDDIKVVDVLTLQSNVKMSSVDVKKTKSPNSYCNPLGDYKEVASLSANRRGNDNIAMFKGASTTSPLVLFKNIRFSRKLPRGDTANLGLIKPRSSVYSDNFLPIHSSGYFKKTQHLGFLTDANVLHKMATMDMFKNNSQFDVKIAKHRDFQTTSQPSTGEDSGQWKQFPIPQTPENKYNNDFQYPSLTFGQLGNPVEAASSNIVNMSEIVQRGDFKKQCDQCFNDMGTFPPGKLLLSPEVSFSNPYKAADNTLRGTPGVKAKSNLVAHSPLTSDLSNNDHILNSTYDLKRGHYFSNLQDSLMAYSQGRLQTHTPFWVRLSSYDELPSVFENFQARLFSQSPEEASEISNAEGSLVANKNKETSVLHEKSQLKQSSNTSTFDTLLTLSSFLESKIASNDIGSPASDNIGSPALRTEQASNTFRGIAGVKDEVKSPRDLGFKVDCTGEPQNLGFVKVVDVGHMGTLHSNVKEVDVIKAQSISLRESDQQSKEPVVGSIDIEPSLLQPRYGCSEELSKALFKEKENHQKSFVEANDSLQAPLELRLGADGNLVKILTTFQNHYNCNATTLDQCKEKSIRYMRTTAGRVVINKTLFHF